LDSGGYTRPANTQGLFIISITKQKFRMPDTQNLSEKGLKSFSSFGGDGTRGYDYPGGFQDAQVGQVTVSLQKGNGYTGGTPNANWFAPGDPSHNQGTDNIVINSGKENIIKNFGVIYFRHV